MKARASRTARELARQDRLRGVRAEYNPLRPEVFSMAVDTREQIIGPIPLDVPVVVSKLPAGDLSVVGFEDKIAIDRKQLGDFIGCVTWQKERFIRLLERLATYDYAAVIVEATVADVRARKYRADVPPAFVLGAAAKVSTKYDVPVFFCGPLDCSTDYAVRLLRCWWRDRGLNPELKAAGT
jgi:ERCC4-type nuclease